MTDLSNCKVGNHKLEKIYAGHTDLISQEMVRWCTNCGSIVVDVDYDGRTNAGQVMKMKSPRIADISR